jgi:hypothetical protein
MGVWTSFGFQLCYQVGTSYGYRALPCTSTSCSHFTIRLQKLEHPVRLRVALLSLYGCRSWFKGAWESGQVLGFSFAIKSEQEMVIGRFPVCLRVALLSPYVCRSWNTLYVYELLSFHCTAAEVGLKAHGSLDKFWVSALLSSRNKLRLSGASLYVYCRSWCKGA